MRDNETHEIDTILSRTKAEEFHASSERTVHEWFGLSYSSYLTLPRVLMQAMPPLWQQRMVRCLEELDEAIEELREEGMIPAEYEVTPGEWVYYNELTPQQRALLGVTTSLEAWDSENPEPDPETATAKELDKYEAARDAAAGEEGFLDRAGNCHNGFDRALVPVPDRLPSYRHPKGLTVSPPVSAQVDDAELLHRILVVSRDPGLADAIFSDATGLWHGDQLRYGDVARFLQRLLALQLTGPRSTAVDSAELAEPAYAADVVVPR